MNKEMFMKKMGYAAGAAALWLGVWLSAAFLLELARRGFVVHYINTRPVWLAFLACFFVWTICRADGTPAV